MDALIEAVDDVRARLDADALEPDPDRDWSSHRAEVDALDRAVRELLHTASTAFETMESEEREAIEERLGFLLGRVAAVYHTSRQREPRSLIMEAERLTRGAPLIAAASSEPVLHAALVHGQWLLRSGHAKRGLAELSRVEKRAKSSVLREAAKLSADVPQPLKSAPSLFTFNSIGVGLYGSRDTWEDGTYITTLCFCALFIPLFPITAYRVFDHGGGQYTFYAKHRLSKFAKACRLALVGAVISTIGAFALIDYLGSPTRQAAVAWADVQSLDPQQDFEAYERLLEDHGEALDGAAFDRAALGLAQAYVAKVPSPLRLQDARLANAAVSRYVALPHRARTGSGARHVLDAAGRWVDELGVASGEHARASLRILELVGRLGDRDARDAIVERGHTLRLQMAKRVEEAWPLEALELYLQMQHVPEAEAAARALFAKIAEHPLLLESVRDRAESWVSTGRDDASNALSASLEDAAKKVADPERAKLFDNPERRALLAHLKKAPWDHVAANHVAQMELDAGAMKAAEARLTRLGPVGWLAPEAQRTLASIAAATGRLDEAEVILEHLLAARASRYRAARQAWEQQAEQLENNLITRLRNGTAPRDLMQKLNTSDEAAGRKLAWDWIRDELSKNPQLVKLAQQGEVLSDVVPTSLMLGSVLLRRASALEGDEREQVLGRAERAYLVVREEASGLPTFHIGLGQVFHRLGKHEDGEAELKRVLEEADGRLALAVAGVYRELGMYGRSTEVATQVYEGSDPQARYAAASTLALIAATVEERETWLKRADPKDESVQVRLRELRARRSMREGRCDEAERELAQVFAWYAKATKVDSSAANNGALTSMRRFECSGDIKHLKRAIAMLERAARLEPESGIVLSNLSQALQYLGQVEVLSTWLDVRRFPPDATEAEELVETLARGPLAEEVRDAKRTNRWYRRLRAVTAQLQVLAPQALDSYTNALVTIESERDLEGLRALQALVERNGVDRSQVDDMAKKWASGSQDASLLERIEGRLARYARIEADKRLKNDARTRAALAYLAGERHEERLMIEPTPDGARRALERFERAHALWPSSGMGSAVPWALWNVAAQEARLGSKELAERWGREGREYGDLYAVARALKGDTTGEVRRALAARPEIRRAVELRRSAAAERPRFGDSMLADLAGDAELARLAKGLFEDPFEAALAKLSLTLYDTAPTRYYAEHFAEAN
ncbi:MAG: hypothetical protein RIT81_11085 [Deltaproteobacteria bacterium]